MEAIGKKRTISFNPCEKFYGKNTCNLPERMEIPIIINDKGDVTGENNFMTNVIKSYSAYQSKQTELSNEYEELMEVIKENVEMITDAVSANEAVKACRTLTIYLILPCRQRI